MKTTQINQIASYRARRTVLSDEVATSARPAFKAALAALDKQLEEIDELTLVQSQPLRATIVERDEALAAMREAALGLAGAAYNYAEDQGEVALALTLRLKPGNFDRVRLERRVPVARLLHEAIEPVVAQLADYGVTPAMLVDFKAKIDAAEALLPAPRDTVVEKKAATALLVVAVRKAGTIFRHRIEPLVRSVRGAYPEFHARYEAARKIVARPGPRSTDAVAEAPTMLPLAEAPSGASRSAHVGTDHDVADLHAARARTPTKPHGEGCASLGIFHGVAITAARAEDEGPTLERELHFGKDTRFDAFHSSGSAPTVIRGLDPILSGPDLVEYQRRAGP